MGIVLLSSFLFLTASVSTPLTLAAFLILLLTSSFILPSLLIITCRYLTTYLQRFYLPAPNFHTAMPSLPHAPSLYVYLCCKDFQQVDMYPRLVGKSIPYPLPFVLCLQKGWTATLKAAYKGHLTVLETLVEQYGGNVLHRMKVTCVVTGALNCTIHSLFFCLEHI